MVAMGRDILSVTSQHNSESIRNRSTSAASRLSWRSRRVGTASRSTDIVRASLRPSRARPEIRMSRTRVTVASLASFAVACLLALAPATSAQLTWGGSPPSQRLALRGRRAAPGELRRCRRREAAYLAEDSQADKATPFRFGATLPVDLGFEHGQWSVAPDGSRIWR